MPIQLLIPDQKLKTESDRLGMDAMSPADAGGHLVLKGHLFNDFPQFKEFFLNQVKRLNHEERERRVDNVIRGKTHVDKA